MPPSASNDPNPQPDSTLYDIIFDGRIAPGRDIDAVKSGLAALYQVDVGDIEGLFTDPPIVIKSGLDRATAMADKSEFEETGALCRVVPASPDKEGHDRERKTQRLRRSIPKPSRAARGASDGRRFRLYQAVFMAFYSRAFYQDVAAHWRGRAFLFFLLLTAFLTGSVCIQIHLRMAAYIDRYGEAFVQQIPTITIRKGRASVDQPQPYVIKDPETNQPAAILDTTGETRSLAGTSAVVLLTSDRLLVKRSPVDMQVFDLTGIDQFQFDQAQARAWMGTMRRWSALIVFPLILFGNLLYRAAQILVYVGIGLIMTRIYDRRLPIGALFSLSIMAITPAILINVLLPAAIATSVVWDILSILISVGLLYFGIKSAMHPETEPGPDSPTDQ